MSGTHSVLSPSKGAMILRCAAALAAGKGVKDAPSQYAAEGTAYHYLASTALEAGTDCTQYVGIRVHVQKDGSCRTDRNDNTEFSFDIDPENAAHAQTYVDAIRRIPGLQYYEVRIDTSEVVGVPGQGGTGDAVTLDFDASTIHVDDLKFGRGEVVFAEKNEQLLQYGAGALNQFALLHDWKFVKLGIHQPRLGHYSEHTYTVEEVRAWVKENRPRFQRAFVLYVYPAQIAATDYVPGEKQCRWCPIRGNCKARADSFLQQFPICEVGGKTVDVTPVPQRDINDEELAYARDRVDAIEQWCADIKAEAHNRAVLMGRTLPGWKVVNGRAGNRKWSESDLVFVENIMVADIGEAAFKPKQIVTPAEAEKKYKAAKRGFGNLEGYITQAEGAKSLVRDDSPKQAVAVSQVEFPIQVPA